MVTDGRDTVEQPVVWDVAEDEHVVVGEYRTANASPARRDQCTYAGTLDGLQNDIYAIFNIFISNINALEGYQSSPWGQKPRQNQTCDKELRQRPGVHIENG